MENNYLELATNAIAIELVKCDHENQNADVHTVNARVSHWEISAITIHGIPAQEWGAQFGIDINYMLRGVWGSRFKVKKHALPFVIESFAKDFLFFYCPVKNFDESEEWLDKMYAAVESLKAGK